MTVTEIAKAHKWGMPTVCPVCGTGLEITDTHSRLYCPNLNCKSVVKGRIAKWCSLLETKGFGIAVIDDLVEKCGVNNISDLYTSAIPFVKLITLDGYGDNKVSNLRKELNKKRKLTLAKFIAGYDIESIGETQAQKIIDEHGFQNIDQMTAGGHQMLISKGIGEITAIKLMKGFIHLKNDMEKTLQFIEIEGAQKPVTGGKLEGLSFCFTGKACLPRPQLEKIVVENGGTNSSVKKGLSYLVSDDGDSNSSKSKKAKELGIPVISSAKFMEMVK